MDLPEDLQRLPFEAWNNAVRFLVEAWEAARQYECQEAFEQFVTSEPRGDALFFLTAIAARALTDLRGLGVAT